MSSVVVRFGSLADIGQPIRDVRFTPNRGHAQRLHQCLLSATSGHIGKLFLVVADTTNLVTNLCVEGGLFERRVCARARQLVGGLFYRSLGGILHNRFTEWSTVIALNVSRLFALIVRMRRHDAV
jgi:hypothetical protein